MENLELAARPDTGSQGRSVEVIANVFEVTRMPTADVYHYEVAFNPRSYPGDDPKRENRNKNIEIIDACKRESPEFFADVPTVYDGKAIMFALSQIFPNGEGTLRASLDRPYQITFTERSKIRPRDLIDLITGKGSAFEPKHLISITMLQLLLSEHSRQQKYPYHGRKMFPPGTRLCDLRGGLELFRAFIHMVRPSVGKLIVVVGIGSGAMYKSLNLIEIAKEFLNVMNIRDIERLDLMSAQGRRLISFLKNVKIRSSMNPNAEVRRKVQSIRGLVAQAGKHEFSHDDQMTTVERYYHGLTNRRMAYPLMFGVRLGKDAVVPAEFCEIVPGQVYRRKIPQQVLPHVQKVTRRSPHELKQEIDKAANSEELNFHGSLYLRRVNMQIAKKPMQFHGRMLDPPDIKYGNNGVCRSKNGQWNMLHFKLQDPAHIQAWSVVLFDTALDERACNVFLQILCNCMLAAGIAIDQKPPIITKGHTGDIRGSLNKAYRLATEGLLPVPKNTIIIAILPDSAADIKMAIKRWGDIETGISTQCVKSGKLKFRDVRDNNGSQYCNNLALKINVKCGGINNSVGGNNFVDTMVLGADVSHPGPGQQKPSMTSLVYSVDDAAARYGALTSIQEPGLEMIQDMDQKVYDALKSYYDYHRSFGKKRLPKRMLFYRDGVSEGELGAVVTFEIRKVKDAIQRLWKEWFSDPSQGPRPPTLTFIVCGKRHHARFFPATQNGSDSKGNFLPGLLVDTEIVHPILFDFYLQSHAGLIGTSRSTHYTVVHDENKLNANFVQRLTYDLCFVYARATRSVSIPAPVYYADIVCERVPNHFPDDVHYESDAATDRSTFDLARWKKQFRSAHPNQAVKFYFM